jgi:hypothetical protein
MKRKVLESRSDTIGKGNVREELEEKAGGRGEYILLEKGPG